MLHKPVFSIIIPLFNRALLLEQTLKSVIEQQFDSYEIIVVNDGSTDNVSEILDKYKSRICVVNQENQGAEIARNSGADCASGEYLVFLDSDDLLLPGALLVYQRILSTENYPPVLFARAGHFRTESHLRALKNASREQVGFTRNKNFFSKRTSVWLGTSIIVINRAIWGEKVRFQKGTFPVDDLDFMLRVGAFEPCIIVQYPSTVAYRNHSGNSIKDVISSINKLFYILELERHGSYRDAKGKKSDRLALIGGHVVSWSKYGLKNKYYAKSILLFIVGFWTVFAGIYKKIRVLINSRFRGSCCEPEIIKIELK